MKEHPILFSGPMVRALLEDRKRVTRLLSKRWLRVKAGDRLWVRETWAPFGDHAAIYQAANIGYPVYRWHPSIHMPRWASRILLECEEDSRLERLQDITEAEALAEGVERCVGHHGFRVYGLAPHAAINHYADPRDSFRSLWSTLHTKPGERWEDNPEVVRVGRFRRVA